MDWSSLLQQYQQINDYFDQQFPQLTAEYRTLARLGKITEELGELNSAVHGELHLHRAEKQAQHHQDEVAHEWADLFNTVMLMGQVLELDIPLVVEERLQQIRRRYDLPEPTP